MKAFAIVLSAMVLTACGSIAHEVASGINNSHLKATVGKPYEQVMYEHPDFGKLIGREQLRTGDQIMKHVGEFGSAKSDIGGIYGKQEHQARVIYFLVDAKGNVKDWAKRVLQGRHGHLLGGDLLRRQAGAGPCRGAGQDREDLQRRSGGRLALGNLSRRACPELVLRQAQDDRAFVDKPVLSLSKG
jgi:hypothetical protein